MEPRPMKNAKLKNTKRNTITTESLANARRARMGKGVLKSAERPTELQRPRAVRRGRCAHYA